MTEKYDLLIRSARRRGDPDRRWDIGIEAGRIRAIEQDLDAEAEVTVDAGGGLVSESFCNPHLHLCKVYTLDRLDEASQQAYQRDEMGKAMTAIELAARVKEEYDQTWIIENVRRALALSVLHGGTHVRGFADVDSKARLEGVKALLQAKQEFEDVLELQVVAFAQDGLIREPGALDLMRQAMDLGADVVGGIPWIEYTDADISAHVRQVFDLAQEFDADVSMLVDDAGDPNLRSLEVMALEAVERGWQGRALAHHARAMHLYPTPYFQKLVVLLKRAQMGVVSDPHTGPLHARVRDLLQEEVLVSLGQDDVSDAYYPYGRNNMLEVAFLVSHLLWMTSRADMQRLYEMITTKAARCMGLQDFELKAGAPANLVVLQAPNVLEALRTHAAPAHVISHGRLIDLERMHQVAETRRW